ncbi:hypothetical protein MHBO_003024 [Bonamia ostreae]|uniref:Uncharacterized protein n=1 Tax=Bonamia ostreae TaxID=126728 RepID=A0ABV2APA1_9EUKA
MFNLILLMCTLIMPHCVPPSRKDIKIDGTVPEQIKENESIYVGLICVKFFEFSPFGHLFKLTCIKNVLVLNNTRNLSVNDIYCGNRGDLVISFAGLIISVILISACFFCVNSDLRHKIHLD